MMKSLTTYFIFFLFLPVVINAQDGMGYQKTKFGNSSPNVSVNGASGELSYSIPICNVELDGLSLPISLSYHYQGNRVTEEASWAGLGWSITGLGQIHRQINGLPDEVHRYNEYGYYLCKGYLMNYESPVSSINNQSDYVYLRDQRVDLQPDILKFNVASQGSGAAFIERKTTHSSPWSTFEDEVQFVSSNYSGVRISDFEQGSEQLQDVQGNFYNNYFFDNFTLRDQMGFEYAFSEKNKTTFTQSSGDPSLKPYPFHTLYTYDEWNLTEITSTFSDDNIAITYHDNTYETTTVSYASIYELDIDLSGDDVIGHDADPEHKSAEFQTIRDVKFPKQVRSRDKLIKFIIDENLRTDASSLPALKRIEIYNIERNWQLEGLVKTIYFHYGYQGTTNKKLMLDSVSIHNTQTELENISFEYYDPPVISDFQPRNSRSHDHWGFANGSATPSTDLCEINIDGYRWTTRRDMLADRKPDYLNTAYGALEEVNYRTGKKERFNYELNKVNGTYSSDIFGENDVDLDTDLDGNFIVGGLRIKKTTLSDNNEFSHYENYQYGHEDANNDVISSGNLISKLKYFELSEVVGSGDTEFSGYHSSSTVSSNSFLSGNIVAYDRIEKTSSGVSPHSLPQISEEPGRMVTFYESPESFYDSGLNSYPYPPVAYQDWNLGRVTKIEYYDNNDLRIRYETFDYSDNVLGQTVPGIKFGPDYLSSSNYDLVDGAYYVNRSRENLLSQHRIFERLENGTFNYTTVNYNYSVYKGAPSEVVTIYPDGTKHKTKAKYVADYDDFIGVTTDEASEAIKYMWAGEAFGVPIEKSSYFIDQSNNEKLIQSQVTFYKRWTNLNNRILPKKTLSSKNIDNVLNYTPSHILNGNFIYDTSTLTKELKEIKEYDEFGQVVHYTSKDEEYETDLITSDKRRTTVAKITNSNRSKTWYNSFENSNFSNEFGNIFVSDGAIQTSTAPLEAITGRYVAEMIAGLGDYSPGFVVQIYTDNAIPVGRYIISYWYSGPAKYEIEGSHTIISDSDIEFQSGWKRKEIQVKIDSPAIFRLFGDPDAGWTPGDDVLKAYVDEIRIHPSDANITATMFDYSMTGNQFNPSFGRKLYQSTSDGRVFHYEYDNKGRLVWVLDREKNVIEHKEYEVKTPAPDSFNKLTSYQVRERGISKSDVDNAGIYDDNIKKQVLYTDGLGRKRQQHSFNVSESNHDQIALWLYDEFGRETTKLLPYYDHLNTDEPFIANAQAEQLNYYSGGVQLDDNEDTNSPWSVTVLEPSPLQRPVEIGGIGDELQPSGGNTNTTKMEYSWNESGDNILKWEYDPINESAIAQTYFPENDLRKETKTDPDGSAVETYKDMRGRIVAQVNIARIWTNSNGHKYTKTASNSSDGTEMRIDSYTVYDDFGRVVYEIPSIAIERMNGTFSLSPGSGNIYNELITHIQYDYEGRVKSKKTPGVEETCYVYDQKDRLIMSQTKWQKDNDIWAFIKYDKLGRTILKGQFSSTLSRDDHQTNANNATATEEDRLASGGTWKYSNNSYPTNISSTDVFNVYYFDTYDFIKPVEFEFTSFDSYTEPLGSTYTMPTGSKTRVFSGTGSQGTVLTTVNYYDKFGRSIQSYSQNHKGGYDQHNYYYNDKDELLKTRQIHKYELASEPVELVYDHSYVSETGANKKTWCTVANDPQVQISNRFYDVKGQLKDLKLHNDPDASNYLQNVDYRYNAQGNLTHINNISLIIDFYNDTDDDVFGQELTYFTPSTEYAPYSDVDIDYKFNGLVSSMMWNAKSPDEDGAMLPKHAYAYRYDDLNRLTKAHYVADSPVEPGYFERAENRYNATYTYDLGGNFLNITRRSRNANYQSILMDNINFEYYNMLGSFFAQRK